MNARHCSGSVLKTRCANRVARQVYAEGTQDSSYTEVNVEDPSPGFQSLRDSVDMQLCLDRNFFQFGAGGGA